MLSKTPMNNIIFTTRWCWTTSTLSGPITRYSRIIAIRVVFIFIDIFRFIIIIQGAKSVIPIVNVTLIYNTVLTTTEATSLRITVMRTRRHIHTIYICTYIYPNRGLKKPHKHTQYYILYTYSYIRCIYIYICIHNITLECSRVDTFEIYTYIFWVSSPAQCACFLSIPFCIVWHYRYYYDCYWHFMTSDNMLNHYQVYSHSHTHTRMHSSILLVYIYIIMLYCRK